MAIDKNAGEDRAFRAAELENLRAWSRLSGGEKIDFFEEMIELAYHSGALRADRLALRDVQTENHRTPNRKP